MSWTGHYCFELEADSVGLPLCWVTYEHLVEGDTVRCTGRILEVPVGRRNIAGRVVDARSSRLI